MNTLPIAPSFLSAPAVKVISTIRCLRASLRLAGLAGLLLGSAFGGRAAEGREYLPWEKGSLKFGGFITAFDSNLGFGVNVAESSDSDYPGADFVGTVDVRYAGLMIYGKVSF
jgi:hypothetical protein